MTEKALIMSVTEKFGGVPQKAAVQAIEAVFETMKEVLQADGMVTISMWGMCSAADIRCS